MSDKNIQNEFYAISEKLLLKLQNLPNAERSEIVAFLIIILFIGTVVALMVIACSYCCTRYSNRKPEHKGRRIKVQPAAHA